MIEEPPRRYNPLVHIPSWTDVLTDDMYSHFFNADCDQLYLQESLASLRRYLPSRNTADFDSNFPVDAYSCDHFRIYEFKVKQCVRGRSHDWTECPYAHPDEKARRRDPRKYHYSGTTCPNFRKGNCIKGDDCEFAHGVFECWLHPTRYRTQWCKEGLNCQRKICFFAHSPEQLRILPSENSRSPSISPPETPLTESPPMTHPFSRSLGSYNINEMLAPFRNLQIDNMKSIPSSPPPCSYSMKIGSPGYASPIISMNRPGLRSPPATGMQESNRIGMSFVNLWDCEEEGVMERVESGRNLRAKMFEKLSKENPLEGVKSGEEDMGWVVNGYGYGRRK